MSVTIPSEVFQEFLTFIDSKILLLHSTRDGETALQALKDIKSKAVEFSPNLQFTEEAERNDGDTPSLSVEAATISDTPSIGVSATISDTAVQSPVIDTPSQGTGRVKTRRKRVSRKISQVCVFDIIY